MNDLRQQIILILVGIFTGVCAELARRITIAINAREVRESTAVLELAMHTAVSSLMESTRRARATNQWDETEKARVRDEAVRRVKLMQPNACKRVEAAGVNVTELLLVMCESAVESNRALAVPPEPVEKDGEL